VSVAASLLRLATGCGTSGTSTSPSPSATAPGSQASPSASSASSAAGQGRCSAAGLPPAPPDQSLPEPVASTRSQIVKAATACDYDALDKIAEGSVEGFSFSFGGQKGKPGDYWRRLESEGRQPLAYLVKALSVSNGVTTLPATLPSPGSTSPNPNLSGGKTIYVWPAAATKDVPTDEDWAELERIYPKDQVAKMKEDTARFGIGYLGWRAGITAPGDWIYFIEGD
jgi:hypothetical protein